MALGRSTGATDRSRRSSGSSGGGLGRSLGGGRRSSTFTAVVALLLALSLLPAAWSGWVSSIADIASLVIRPVSGPVYAVARWLAPARGTGVVDDPTVAGLVEERERFRTLWLREQERSSELERKIVELQQGLAYTELPVRQVSTSVIGTSSEGTIGELVVRAAGGAGVEINNVVTAAGVQVVGRVARVGLQQSFVRLLTDPATKQVRGRVMRADESKGPLCALFPLKSGDGLQGQVEYRSGEPEVEVGQLVRLDDDQWPRSASMLVIGRIEEISTTTGGRPVIRVRPTLDLTRLSEVVIRTNPPSTSPTNTDPSKPAPTDGGAP